MSTDMMLIGDGNMQLPAHLTGINLGITDRLKEGMHQGGNRISLKSSRFRIIADGKEEYIFDEPYIDVVMLSAAPAVSRLYYSKTYQQGENAAPDCYSADGVVPATDVKNRQADKCALCPQNVKGSKTDGGQKYKACGFMRRLVVAFATDTEHRRVYKLDVKAQGLFGEAYKNSKGEESHALNDYIKFVSNRNLDLGMVVTRISFDPNASVPKLVFRAFRFVNPEELAMVQALVGTPEVEELAQVTMATVDSSGEEPTAEVPAQAPAEAAQEAPAQTATPAQEEAPPARTEAKPAPQTAPPTGNRPPPPSNKPQPVQQSTAVKIDDDVPPPAKQSAPAQTAAQPVVEVATNSELDDILAGLV